MHKIRMVALGLALVVAAAVGHADRLGAPALAGPAPRATAAPTTTSAATPAVPRPAHTVVVMLENKTRDSVLGSGQAPYLDRLAASGALMSQSYGVAHPSQPNYIALFSGSQQGVTSDACPQSFPAADNLGRQLLDAGLTFTGYAESMPTAGYTGCSKGNYQRKHNSWVDFDLPAKVNQPFSAFPRDFTKLPTVAFVTPNMCSDMHDCSVATGDAWVEDNLDAYAAWAKTHNSLLVVTFDENSGGTVNQIPTFLVGQKVRRGTFAEQMNHYSLLRTIEDAYGLPALGGAASVSSLRTIWTTTSAAATAPHSITNGSFALGLAGWATSGSTTTTSSSRHGGSLIARAGGSKATTGDSILSQTFVVPKGKKKLSVSWLGRCSDKVSKAWGTVKLRANAKGTVSTPLARTCSRNGSWRTVTAKVSAGGSYTLSLVNHDDGVAATPNRTYFDDVKLS